MLHPSYSDLMKVANSEVEPGEQPVVQSRYSIVIATAKRARQIIDENAKERELKDKLRDAYVEKKHDPRKPLSIAIDELYTEKIKIVGDEDQ